MSVACPTIMLYCAFVICKYMASIIKVQSSDGKSTTICYRTLYFSLPFSPPSESACPYWDVYEITTTERIGSAIVYTVIQSANGLFIRRNQPNYGFVCSWVPRTFIWSSLGVSNRLRRYRIYLRIVRVLIRIAFRVPETHLVRNRPKIPKSKAFGPSELRLNYANQGFGRC